MQNEITKKEELFMENKMRCAVYIRTASSSEEDHQLCTQQEERIKAYIAQHDNMQYYKTFEDRGWSGAHLQRPALQQLLTDVQQHHCDVIITDALHRLTRSPRDFRSLCDMFDACGVRFIALMQHLDTATPEAQQLREAMLLFAQCEQEIKEQHSREQHCEGGTVYAE